MIIAVVRGFLLNFGVYHATRSALRLPFEVRPRRCLAFASAHLSAVEPCHHVHHLLCHPLRDRYRHYEGASLDSLTLHALSRPQDLPDVEGDREHNIQTFATQMGVRNVSLLVRGASSRPVDWQ